jgi:hypothetical protein
LGLEGSLLRVETRVAKALDGTLLVRMDVECPVDRAIGAHTQYVLQDVGTVVNRPGNAFWRAVRLETWGHDVYRILRITMAVVVVQG